MKEIRRSVKEILSLIKKAQEEIKRHLREYKDLETELFNTCTHPKEEVLEGEWKEGNIFNNYLPFRVCKLCGYAEEGGGPYAKLSYPDASISPVRREEARRHIRRLFSQEEIHKRVDTTPNHLYFFRK